MAISCGLCSWVSARWWARRGRRIVTPRARAAARCSAGCRSLLAPVLAGAAQRAPRAVPTSEFVRGAPALDRRRGGPPASRGCRDDRPDPGCAGHRRCGGATRPRTALPMPASRRCSPSRFHDPELLMAALLASRSATTTAAAVEVSMRRAFAVLADHRERCLGMRRSACRPPTSRPISASTSVAGPRRRRLGGRPRRRSTTSAGWRPAPAVAGSCWSPSNCGTSSESLRSPAAAATSPPAWRTRTPPSRTCSPMPSSAMRWPTRRRARLVAGAQFKLDAAAAVVTPRSLLPSEPASARRRCWRAERRLPGLAVVVARRSVRRPPAGGSRRARSPAADRDAYDALRSTSVGAWSPCSWPGTPRLSGLFRRQHPDCWPVRPAWSRRAGQPGRARHHAVAGVGGRPRHEW